MITYDFFDLKKIVSGKKYFHQKYAVFFAYTFLSLRKFTHNWKFATVYVSALVIVIFFLGLKTSFEIVHALWSIFSTIVNAWYPKYPTGLYAYEHVWKTLLLNMPYWEVFGHYAVSKTRKLKTCFWNLYLEQNSYMFFVGLNFSNIEKKFNKLSHLR